MGDAPDVAVNRTCLRFDDPGAFGDQHYWMYPDGAPLSPHAHGPDADSKPLTW